jgi:hypothetical protein
LLPGIDEHHPRVVLEGEAHDGAGNHFLALIALLRLDLRITAHRGPDAVGIDLIQREHGHVPAAAIAALLRAVAPVAAGLGGDDDAVVLPELVAQLAVVVVRARLLEGVEHPGHPLPHLPVPIPQPQRHVLHGVGGAGGVDDLVEPVDRRLEHVGVELLERAAELRAGGVEVRQVLRQRLIDPVLHFAQIVAEAEEQPVELLEQVGEALIDGLLLAEPGQRVRDRLLGLLRGELADRVVGLPGFLDRLTLLIHLPGVALQHVLDELIPLLHVQRRVDPADGDAARPPLVLVQQVLDALKQRLLSAVLGVEGRDPDVPVEILQQLRRLLAEGVAAGVGEIEAEVAAVRDPVGEDDDRQHGEDQHGHVQPVLQPALPLGGDPGGRRLRGLGLGGGVVAFGLIHGWCPAKLRVRVVCGARSRGARINATCGSRSP